MTLTSTARIERIEIHRHLFLQHFCARVFLVGDPVPVARIDDLKVTFSSTLATRLAGLDALLTNVTLQKLVSHPLAIIM